MGPLVPQRGSRGAMVFTDELLVSSVNLDNADQKHQRQEERGTAQDLAQPRTPPRFFLLLKLAFFRVLVLRHERSKEMVKSRTLRTPTRRVLAKRQGSGSKEALTDFVTTALSNRFTLESPERESELKHWRMVRKRVLVLQPPLPLRTNLIELQDGLAQDAAILSAATGTAPSFNSTGNPLTNVTEFSQVLDYVAIMAYDINGPWGADAGPNALHDSTFSVAETIVFGVTSYGHSFRVKGQSMPSTAQALYPPFDAADRPVATRGTASPETKTNAASLNCRAASSISGAHSAALSERGWHTEERGPYLLDSWTQTPYVYNKTTQVLNSFDNADSIAAKADKAAEFADSRSIVVS
ncbi:hypothetical protein B0H16DRAFT_1711896 [Mycena metata]|uniref:GH18 domain-containing protein n=1 Tax=Mycena metata TaxID=1033252 RepID=A0AAD7K9F6_9AGAR|nr:hypothetical protein B0H16DRAFT_1711896 [Mycena metata]